MICNVRSTWTRTYYRFVIDISLVSHHFVSRVSNRYLNSKVVWRLIPLSHMPLITDLISTSGSDSEAHSGSVDDQRRKSIG